MSHCIGHTQCPRCAARGNDRSGDNLAQYSDGGAYCFLCGYTIPSSGIARLKARDHIVEQRAISLPNDSTEQLPRHVLEYLKQYPLTDIDIKLNCILWSEYWQRVIFPYFDSTGLCAWQGRYLGNEQGKAKWFSQGDLKNHIHVVGNTKKDTVVLTEDIISAIVVSHNPAVCASPLFGSHISTQRMLRLKKFYDTIIVWLDKDKEVDAVKFSNTARLFGINSRCIITDKDPKEYTDEEVTGWLCN